jgi:AraC-like DNA-binding protein
MTTILVSNTYAPILKSMNDPKSRQQGETGLERLCKASEREHIVHDASLPGFERMEAAFEGEAFTPHRHDTYALGITLKGAQTFHYRGERRVSLPGNAIILHPDEVHDGAAGDEEGLKYRMLYLEPSLLAPALAGSGHTLPFVDNPVVDHPPLTRLLLSVLSSMGDRLDELEMDGFLALAAPILSELSTRTVEPTDTPPVLEMQRVRDYLAAHWDENISSARLENIAGVDRFALARHFRALYGTTPHRFLVMRRLAAAREKISAGAALADIAADTGFADQAHFSRHFKKAFGLTPGRWAVLARAGQ